MTNDPLETIVPPFRMCKAAFDLDPEAFSGSVFAWSLPCDKRKTEPFVDRRDDIGFCRRDLLNAPPVYPAPTLKEILADLYNFDLQKFGLHADCSIISKIDPEKFSPIIEHADPTAAAMRLWLLIRHETAETDRTKKGEKK
ncbi:MAG: hypothetical protein IJU70_11915 [Lentisphaeria bacterium]|nr:hypothetical protein [Lentisphaeria bacterium]